MTGKQHLVDDVDFVFSECARFRAEWLTKRSFEPNSPEAMEHFCTIPHHEVSWSFQVCGRKAYDALDRLSRIAVKNADIDGSVDLTNVRKELSSVIVRKFQVEKRSIDIRNVERALAEAARRAAAQRKNVVHFLACHLMLAKDPSTFRIGPVTFHSQKNYRSILASTLRAERVKLKRDRKFLNDAFSYYRAFGWVAEVEIVSCDDKTSKRLAEETVSSALDGIHLLLGYRNTHRMVIEGPAVRIDRRARITRSEGSLSYSVSYGGPGEVGFPNGWFAQFEQSGWDVALQLIGVALELIIDPRLDRPLSRRFLDAAKWFGEAVREASPAAKVVKYTTALERMLMTDERDDIAEVVSDRAAAMCCDLPSQTSFDVWKADTKKAYAVRSKLVHGSMSQSSQEVYEGVRLAAMVSEAAIHSALAGYGVEGLTAQSVSTKRLGEWYAARVKHVREILR